MRVSFATQPARSDRPNEDFVIASPDAAVLLDGAGITDGRGGEIGARYRAVMDALDSGTEDHASALRAYVETLQAHRNRDGGFWVAAADPLAADHALTGAVPASEVRAAALLSDGASRLVDRFGLLTWRDLLDILDGEGPAGLIQRTRQAEESDPIGRRWPRGKAFDDATAVLVRTGLVGAGGQGLGDVVPGVPVEAALVTSSGRKRSA